MLPKFRRSGSVEKGPESLDTIERSKPVEVAFGAVAALGLYYVARKGGDLQIGIPPLDRALDQMTHSMRVLISNIV